jgi:hypothetical protein
VGMVPLQQLDRGPRRVLLVEDGGEQLVFDSQRRHARHQLIGAAELASALSYDFARHSARDGSAPSRALFSPDWWISQNERLWNGGTSVDVRCDATGHLTTLRRITFSSGVA